MNHASNDLRIPYLTTRPSFTLGDKDISVGNESGTSTTFCQLGNAGKAGKACGLVCVIGKLQRFHCV
jgi:hypothetical protein